MHATKLVLVQFFKLANTQYISTIKVCLLLSVLSFNFQVLFYVEKY